MSAGLLAWIVLWSIFGTAVGTWAGLAIADQAWKGRKVPVRWVRTGRTYTPEDRGEG